MEQCHEYLNISLFYLISSPVNFAWWVTTILISLWSLKVFIFKFSEFNPLKTSLEYTETEVYGKCMHIKSSSVGHNKLDMIAIIILIVLPLGRSHCGFDNFQPKTLLNEKTGKVYAYLVQNKWAACGPGGSLGILLVPMRVQKNVEKGSLLWPKASTTSVRKQVVFQSNIWCFWEKGLFFSLTFDVFEKKGCFSV